MAGIVTYKQSHETFNKLCMGNLDELKRRVLGPVLAAVADDRSPPELGRLVECFDWHVELWKGRRMAA